MYYFKKDIIDNKKELYYIGISNNQLIHKKTNLLLPYPVIEGLASYAFTSYSWFNVDNKQYVCFLDNKNGGDVYVSDDNVNFNYLDKMENLPPVHHKDRSCYFKNAYYYIMSKNIYKFSNQQTSLLEGYTFDNGDYNGNSMDNIIGNDHSDVLLLQDYIKYPGDTYNTFRYYLIKDFSKGEKNFTNVGEYNVSEYRILGANISDDTAVICYRSKANDPAYSNMTSTNDLFVKVTKDYNNWENYLIGDIGTDTQVVGSSDKLLQVLNGTWILINSFRYYDIQYQYIYKSNDGINWEKIYLDFDNTDEEMQKEKWIEMFKLDNKILLCQFKMNKSARNTCSKVVYIYDGNTLTRYNNLYNIGDKESLTVLDNILYFKKN